MCKRKGRTARRRKWIRIRGSAPGESVCQTGYKELLQWMKKQFRFSSKILKVATFPHIGRGIAAKQKISSEDRIISVPKSALIGVSQAIKDSFLLRLIQTKCDCESPPSSKISGSQALCIFLIEERRKVLLICDNEHKKLAKWSPYVRVLPEDFTHPLYWNSATISLLPIHLQNEIKTMKCKVESDWTVCRRLVGSSKSRIDREERNKFVSYLTRDITYEEYKWAWCCVNTRCVYSDHNVPRYNFLQPSKSDHYFLVPFLDLLNHSAEAKVKASFNSETQHFEIVTFTEYKKHQQLFINYGDHCNEKLLMEYGFVSASETNKNDVVKVEWSDVVKIYNLPNNQTVALREFLRKRGLDTDLCFGFDGPSWSLVITVLVFEIFACGLLEQSKIISRIKLSSEQGRNLKIKVHKRLNILARKVDQSMHERINRCETLRLCAEDEQENVHVEIAKSYLIICKKLLSFSVENVSSFELSDCDFISCLD